LSTPNLDGLTDAQRFAYFFALTMVEYAGDDIEEIRRRNAEYAKQPGNEGLCASGDLFDSNICVEPAFLAAFSRVFDYAEADLVIVGDGWHIAQKTGFRATECEAPNTDNERQN